VDRREHEIVLVEMRRDRLGTGGLRWIQGQLAEEAPRDQLVEIARAGTGIVVQALQMGQISTAD
jgi:hypothetical protein